MKRYWSLAAFGCAVLSVAAVWLGGLNQDEGWYLYAAQLVAEGKAPYRDFFYTQAPVMPMVYSAFAWVWRAHGLLGARIFTLTIGLLGVVFACALAYRLTPPRWRPQAAVAVLLLLGSNLYHIYYIAIPKTYALASLFVLAGFYLLSFAVERGRRFAPAYAVAAGLSLAFAAGSRISLGILLAIIGFWLLFTFRRTRWAFLWFGIGGTLGLAVAYGPFLVDPASRAGLIAAQTYHTSREGFSLVFTIGSVSRLVRWYLPMFIMLGLGGFRSVRLLGIAFLSVFVVQMLAPFPYEDYQVPVMGILAAYVSVNFFSRLDERNVKPSTRPLLLIIGLAWACSFGSPLLEKWTTNGQDRFWTLKKDKCELAQLRDVARLIEKEDPGGKTLLTQDLYIAVETGRKVPEGLEMGPFSMLKDEEWRKLLTSAPCPIAALSGYSFAIDPPGCGRAPIERELSYWMLLKKDYDPLTKVDAFGQNATSLMILKRKAAK